MSSAAEGERWRRRASRCAQPPPGIGALLRTRARPTRCCGRGPIDVHVRQSPHALAACSLDARASAPPIGVARAPRRPQVSRRALAQKLAHRPPRCAVPTGLCDHSTVGSASSGRAPMASQLSPEVPSKERLEQVRQQCRQELAQLVMFMEELKRRQAALRARAGSASSAIGGRLAAARSPDLASRGVSVQCRPPGSDLAGASVPTGRIPNMSVGSVRVGTDVRPTPSSKRFLSKTASAQNTP